MKNDPRSVAAFHGISMTLRLKMGYRFKKQTTLFKQWSSFVCVEVAKRVHHINVQGPADGSQWYTYTYTYTYTYIHAHTDRELQLYILYMRLCNAFTFTVHADVPSVYLEAHMHALCVGSGVVTPPWLAISICSQLLVSHVWSAIKRQLRHVTVSGEAEFNACSAFRVQCAGVDWYNGKVDDRRGLIWLEMVNFVWTCLILLYVLRGEPKETLDTTLW